MHILKNKKMIGHILAVFTIFVWGTTFIANKLLLNNGFSPIEILLLRFLMAYIALFLIYPKIFKFTNWKHELLFFLASISGISIYQLLENIATDLSHPSNVSIITACSVFFTVYISKILLKDEKVSKYFLLGFIISIIGVVLVTINGGKISVFPLGDFLSFIAAIFWGFYGVFIKMISKYNYNSLLVTRRTMLYGTIMIIPMCIFEKSSFPVNDIIDIENLLLIIFLSLIASALCFLTWNLAVEYIGAVKTGLYMYFNPVVTIIFDVIIFSKAITWMGAIGIVLIFIGLYFSSLKNKSYS